MASLILCKYFTPMLIYLCCTLSLLTYSNAAISDWKDELDQFVADVMQCRTVPGLSLSIVQDGQLLLAEGYGDQERDPSTKANAGTVYPIGSLTKSFTSSVIADVLSKQSGNVTWDTPIRSILGSSFSLDGCFRTDEVNLRDLLSHRVDLEEEEIFTVMGLDMEKSDFIKRIRFLDEKYSFRSRFVYSNYMYTLAGLVAERLVKDNTGDEDSWEELVEKRLLRPLGMSSTYMISDTDNLGSISNLAAGYGTSSTGEVLPISLETLRMCDVTAPSGTIMSTANDMAEWMMFQLNGGRSSRTGTQVVEQMYLRETQRSQIALHSPDIMDRADYPIDDSKTDYGMGWIEGQYRGVTRLSHPGNIASYNSEIWLFPSENFGIFVAMNGPMDGKEAVRALKSISWFITDKLMSQQPWQDSESACDSWEPTPTPRSDERQNVPSTAAPTPIDSSEIELDDYDGTYGNVVYGDLKIESSVDEEGVEHLRYTYGKFGTGRLYPTATQHTFKTTINGEQWYYGDSLHFNDQHPGGIYMKFTGFNRGKMETVIFPLRGVATSQGLKFKRGVSASDSRTSPYVTNQCIETSGSGSFRGIFTITIISLSCVMFVLRI